MNTTEKRRRRTNSAHTAVFWRFGPRCSSTVNVILFHATLGNSSSHGYEVPSILDGCHTGFGLVTLSSLSGGSSPASVNGTEISLERRRSLPLRIKIFDVSIGLVLFQGFLLDKVGHHALDGLTVLTSVGIIANASTKVLWWNAMDRSMRLLVRRFSSPAIR